MKNLSLTYHFNKLCIQSNTEGLTMENTLITFKEHDCINPECSRLSMATDCKFSLGAAPGNRETHVKLAVLMWIFTLDNDHNSKGNLYVKSCRIITPLYPKIFKTEIKLNPPFPIKMYAEEFIHSCSFSKIILCEITQNSALKSIWLGTLLKQSLLWINLLTRITFDSI